MKILGVEPPSVADVNDLEEVTRIHKILLSAGIVIVEGLTHLEAISSPRVHFTALPLKIDGGDGSPCRAFALAPDQAWLKPNPLQTAELPREGTIGLKGQNR